MESLGGGRRKGEGGGGGQTREGMRINEKRKEKGEGIRRIAGETKEGKRSSAGETGMTGGTHLSYSRGEKRGRARLPGEAG